MIMNENTQRRRSEGEFTNTKEKLEHAAEKLWEAIMQVRSDVEYDPDYGYSLYSDPIKNALLLVCDAARDDAIDCLSERYDSRINRLEEYVLALESGMLQIIHHLNPPNP